MAHSINNLGCGVFFGVDQGYFLQNFLMLFCELEMIFVTLRTFFFFFILILPKVIVVIVLLLAAFWIYKKFFSQNG